MKELNKAKELQDLESLASNIRTLMWNYSMTQSDLARTVGVPQPTINRVILCRSMPKVSTIKNIADFYSVSLDSMLERNGVDLDPTIRNSKLMSRLKSELDMVSKPDAIPLHRKFYNMFRVGRSDNANS